MIIGALLPLLGYLSGTGFTKLSHKRPGGRLFIQFIGVIVIPLAVAWLLAGGEFQGQKIGLAIGAAIIGHLMSRKPVKE
jgi:hypothetical protein